MKDRTKEKTGMVDVNRVTAALEWKGGVLVNTVHVSYVMKDFLNCDDQ
jgi:hypothetical protein